jgi:hypothetical protein
VIDNPENGPSPEIQDTEADPAQETRTATAVAQPDAQISQPGEIRSAQPSSSSPEMSPQAVTPMADPAPTAQAAGNESSELPVTTEPVSEAELSSELTKFRQRFEEIQAEFISEPRAAVENAETLIDGLMNALHDQLQRIHSNVESETDTEQLRVAMLGYRELFDSLGDHRAA